MAVQLEEVKYLTTEMKIKRKEIMKIANILKRTDKVYCAEEDLSLTSVAPTMDDVDLELSQYEDLLGDVFPNNFQPISGVNSSASFPWLDDLKELENILKDNLASLSLSSDMPTLDGEGELDLEGIDDSELDEMILGENEVKIKTLKWMREYADFLREMKEKEGKKPPKRSKQSTEEVLKEGIYSAATKKIRLDTTGCLPEVQKQEAESDVNDSNDHDEMTEATV